MRRYWFILYLIFVIPQIGSSQNTRIPIWANQSYPGNPDSLKNLINNYLLDKNKIDESYKIKVLIVPHYPKAWDITANGIKQIENDKPRTVVIIGNRHE